MNFSLVCDPAAECGQMFEGGASRRPARAAPQTRMHSHRLSFLTHPPRAARPHSSPLELSKAEAPTPVSPTPFFQGMPHFLIIFSNAGSKSHLLRCTS